MCATPIAVRKLEEKFYIPDDSDTQSQTSENGIRSDFTNSENDFSDVEDFRPNGVPLRHARRKSITLSPKMLKPPGDDESGSNSPGNSITSINSLASLLREKMQMLPTTIKKKKPKDYKIRAFVGFLFLTIVLLVGLAYVLYHQKVLQRAYFDKIKFSKVQRIIKIYNAEGVDIVQGRLGTTLNYDKVLPCLAEDDRNDGSICMEWMHRARLYLHFYELHEDVRCYNMKWISLSKDLEPTDCIDLHESGHWYGGGQNAESAWPLEKGGHDFAPFVTGRVDKHQWGNVLKRYFINSKGAALIIDDKTPLYTAIEGDGAEKRLCLKAKYDDFAYVNRNTPLPVLNYSICTSPNMTQLHSFMSEKSLYDVLRPNEVDDINKLISEPIWEFPSGRDNFTEDAIFDYIANINQNSQLGHVLINEFWQRHVGDFTVDKERFATFEKTLEIIRRRGFRVVFSIQPFISTESSNFARAVKKRILISERSSDRRIPALTRYKYAGSAGMLDVTNNKTMPWLLDKLKNVINEYKFDAFYLDIGTAYNVPHYYQCEKTLTNPDEYKSIFINSLQQTNNVFAVNSIVDKPSRPTFVSLPMFDSTWDGLRQIIPTVLTYGLTGYIYLIPGAVGGDYNVPPMINGTVTLPDKELYIRWLQLSTFLPVTHFTHVPSVYGDSKITEIARTLTILRNQKVVPLLKKYVNESWYMGMPLIRPLWMLDPNDPVCQTITDEFSVGEGLIVAPILHSGTREREIYLPAGVWRDGIDGSLRKGSRWTHDYKVAEMEIAYFERMPDNTRF
ncbi:PREDICTED: uncharacterized family 31 glucosidase KIAA1161 isoform X2 [Nicrophorus vespilloides]|uniref:Uncharacterized family 31 glucosidase KIAA1161 isoform X2 n=1 Tax=Nicrophorus vespilloides TaxID=110193 RepID=A0ABM1MEN4_NICVS|nr:PREDICTED: uncharacterized family 31 glucosidase KIAA1161 isoform X2 [Nicrophorus vespilloides]